MQGTTTGHVPFVSNGIGIVVLANSALILASMFGFVALEHVFAGLFRVLCQLWEFAIDRRSINVRRRGWRND
jgi:hypothetical protein